MAVHNVMVIGQTFQDLGNINLQDFTVRIYKAQVVTFSPRDAVLGPLVPISYPKCGRNHGGTSKCVKRSLYNFNDLTWLRY